MHANLLLQEGAGLADKEKVALTVVDPLRIPSPATVRRHASVSLIVLSLLVVWTFLPGHGPYSHRYFLPLVGAGFLLAGTSRLLPWDRILQRPRGPWVLFGWSAFDILGASGIMMLSGHAQSQFIWIYVLSLIFSATFYSSTGQAVLLALTFIAYLIVAGTGTGFSLATTALHLAGLALIAMMAGYLSAELRARVGDLNIAEQLHRSRAHLLGLVARTARQLESLERREVVEVAAAAVARFGFTRSGFCVLDADGWRLAWCASSVEGGGTPVCVPLSFGAPLCPADILDRLRTGETLVADADDGRLLVAVAVRQPARLLGALVGERSAVEPLREDERECLELLATQAAAALETVERFEAGQDLQERLSHQAHHDPLTGLANRLQLHDTVQALLRGTPGSAAALLFVDLDGFKVVNDTMGHEAGDELLVMVAARFAGCVRPGDTVARYGGDEFVVLAEGIGNAIAAETVAERLLGSLAEPIELEGGPVVVGASIGVHFVSADDAGGLTDEQAEESTERCFRAADQAMYRAKEAGKGRWALSESAALAMQGQLLQLQST